MSLTPTKIPGSATSPTDVTEHSAGVNVNTIESGRALCTSYYITTANRKTSLPSSIWVKDAVVMKARIGSRKISRFCCILISYLILSRRVVPVWLAAHDPHRSSTQGAPVVLMLAVDIPVEHPPLEDILEVLSVQDLLVERSAELEVEAVADTVQGNLVAEVLKARVLRHDLRLKYLEPRREDLNLRLKALAP